jgi:hypothetical protein
MLTFNNPIMQEIAMAFIEKHGGTKDLLLIGEKGNQTPILIDMKPEYKAMMKRLAESKRKEADAIDAQLLLSELAQTLKVDIVETH